VTATRAPSSALTSFVVASRYVPVYLALILLLIVAAIWAPTVLGSVSLSAIAPVGAVLGIAALGEMLVIMTGDDHGANLTPDHFNAFSSLSPINCSVLDWECIKIY